MPPKKKDQTPERHAMDAALLLLKFRGRSEAELSRRLEQKGFPEDVVRRTVGRLRELNLVNDEDLARRWVEGGRAAGRGEIRLRRELWKRGIPRAVIDGALAPSALSPDEDGSRVEGKNESGRAWENLQRRAKRTKAPDRRTLYRRLGGYLARQGFSPEAARDALERYFSQIKEENDFEA